MEAAPAPTITLASTLLNGGLLLIMLLGFSMLLDAQVSIPVYIMFLLAGSAIYAPLINAMTFIALINYMKLSAERIDALCNTPVLPEGTIEEVTGSEVEFRNVDFSYRTIGVGKDNADSSHSPLLGCKQRGNPAWWAKRQGLYLTYADAANFHCLSGRVSFQ